MTCHSFLGKGEFSTVAYRTTEKMAARKDARRPAILEAAAGLFGESGYLATTVPMIVARSGSSTGSFYLHFRNKEDVFAAALEALGLEVLQMVREAHAAASGIPAQVRAGVEALFLFLARNPRRARLMIVESSGLSPRLESLRRALLGRHAAEVQAILETCAGALAGIGPAIAARCLVGAVCESLYTWLESPDDGRPPAVEVARAVADYNVRALALP
jgi:TetR/AcrR family transcriptional regulator, fatty acid metabolism regulator protein